MVVRPAMLCAILLLGGFGPQVAAQTFIKRYDPLGQSLAQFGFGIERSTSGGYVAVSASEVIIQDSLYSSSIFLTVHVAEDGVVLSSDTAFLDLHALYPGWSNCMNATADGGFVCGGGTFTGDWIQKFALYRMDAVGNVEWFHQYGTEGETWIGWQAIQTKDGGNLLVGQTSALGTVDGAVIKTDALGVEQWRRIYGSSQFHDHWISADTTLNDEILVAGDTRIAQNNLEFWLARLSATGDTLWNAVWGGPHDDGIAAMSAMANGNAIVSSTIGYSPSFGSMRCYMAEVDGLSGDRIWEKEYGPVTSNTTLYAVKEVAPGQGFIATGYQYPPGSGFFQGILMRAAANGDSLWMRNYSYYDSLMTDGVCILRDVVPTTDGGFIACGMTNGSWTGVTPPGYSQDLLIVKVDSLGCILPGCNIPMGITSQITNMGYALNVYPNPVRDLLHVGIKLPTGFKTEGPLVLTIVTADGKLVRQESLPKSAWDDMLIDVTGLLAGTYTIHLSDAHTWIAGKKFVVE